MTQLVCAGYELKETESRGSDGTSWIRAVHSSSIRERQKGDDAANTHRQALGTCACWTRTLPRKKEVPALPATWMRSEDIMLSEVLRQILSGFTFLRYLQYRIHRDRQQSHGYRGWERVSREVTVERVQSFRLRRRKCSADGSSW